jgi:hypothetical protein
MAILVAKAVFFEANNYREVSTKELDVLLSWYGVDMKGMRRKGEKVEKWKEIWASNTELPNIEVWTAEDEEKLPEMSNRDINMSETYLGRLAALQKRNAVAAVLDMSEDEWESLKALREADAGNLTQSVIMPEDNDNILCALEAANETIGGENSEEAV